MRAFNYVFEAYLGEPISGQSDNLSKSLQSYNLSAVDVQCITNATMETLNSTRNDESFDSLWEKNVDICQEIGCERANPS